MPRARRRPGEPIIREEVVEKPRGGNEERQLPRDPAKPRVCAGPRVELAEERNRRRESGEEESRQRAERGVSESPADGVGVDRPRRREQARCPERQTEPGRRAHGERKEKLEPGAQRERRCALAAGVQQSGFRGAAADEEDARGSRERERDRGRGAREQRDDGTLTPCTEPTCPAYRKDTVA